MKNVAAEILSLLFNLKSYSEIEADWFFYLCFSLSEGESFLAHTD